MTMPFGVFRGREITQLPSGYLRHLLTTNLRSPFRENILAEHQLRELLTGRRLQTPTQSQGVGRDSSEAKPNGIS